MVGMLMDIGRMQAGSLKLELCDINLADFMREFCHDARLLCKQKNIEFMLGTIPVVHVEADPHYLRQVFFNLLDNSCKHSPVGGRISLDYAVSDTQVLIRFSDTGSGISPDDLPNIFEPFFKGSQGNSGNLTGAGLGLALVRWVVEALRGSITAQSQVGAWSAFEIRLPVFRPSDL
jgi:signal transduction histidine kinase